MSDKDRFDYQIYGDLTRFANDNINHPAGSDTNFYNGFLQGAGKIAAYVASGDYEPLSIPDLRAKHRAELFKELAAKIDDDPSCLFGVLHGGDCFDGAVVTWIAAQYRKENTNANED